MSKVVKLHVHKNTLAQRKRKDLRREATAALNGALGVGNPKAYVIVVLDEDETATTLSNDGGFSLSQFALLVREATSDEALTAPAMLIDSGEE